MPFFTTPDGRRLAYETYGHGPPLVCQPGGPGIPGAVFGGLGGLDRFRTLVKLDPRGTGDSDPPLSSDGYSLGDYVSDLLLLQEHLGLERIDLLGHSHGSFVALLFAATHPGMTGRLILLGAATRFTEGDLERIAQDLQQRSDEPWFEDAFSAMEEEEAHRFESDAELGRLLARMLPFYFGGIGENEEAFIGAMTRQPVNAAAHDYFDANEFFSFDLQPVLAEISAPTLVIAGERDFLFPPAVCRDVAEGIADARLEVLAGAGHFPWIERPDEFAGVVSAFLN